MSVREPHPVPPVPSRLTRSSLFRSAWALHRPPRPSSPYLVTISCFRGIEFVGPLRFASLADSSPLTIPPSPLRSAFSALRTSNRAHIASLMGPIATSHTSGRFAVRGVGEGPLDAHYAANVLDCASCSGLLRALPGPVSVGGCILGIIRLSQRRSARVLMLRELRVCLGALCSRILARFQLTDSI